MSTKYLVIDTCGDKPEAMTKGQIHDMILGYHREMDFDTTEKDLNDLSIKKLDNIVGGFGKAIVLGI